MTDHIGPDGFLGHLGRLGPVVLLVCQVVLRLGGFQVMS